MAPRLAEQFTVVATDLRGFGDSGKPPSAAYHTPYSIRELARDQIEVMRTLGYTRFSVVGHDRGARCAYRLALDYPDAVSRLAVLDIVPTGDAFRAAGTDFALGFRVWSFLAAPAPVPEQLIAAAPARWRNGTSHSRCGAHGLTTCRAAPSRLDTSWPKRHPKTHCGTSSDSSGSHAGLSPL